MKTAKFNSNSSGQALLFVLLGMAVALTVVLSVLSNSVTNLRITSNEGEALRAFSAAEAGIEKALIAGALTTGSFGDANFTASVSSFASATKTFVYPQTVLSGDVATVWFVEHAVDGSLICDSTHPCFTGSNIKFCWGKVGTSATLATTPALSVQFIFNTSSASQYTPTNIVAGSFTPTFVPSTNGSRTYIARLGVDPNATRRATNFFWAPDSGTCTIDNNSYAFQKTIALSSLSIPPSVYTNPNGLQMARVRFLYNDIGQTFGVDANLAGNSNLPSQGIKVDSTGIAGEATRRVEVIRTHSDLPAIFDSVVFSNVGVAK